MRGLWKSPKFVCVVFAFYMAIFDLPELMLKFGSIFADPPTRGGPELASFEARFIPDKPGEFTVLFIMENHTLKKTNTFRV